MPVWLSAYLASGAVMFVIDAAWLTFASARIYRPQLGALMRDRIDIAPAAAFYLIYALAIAVLVVLPAVARRDAMSAIAPGLLLGLAAYGTYNLTNASVIKGWPTALTFIDLAWGTFASAVTAYIASFILLRFAGG